MTHSMPRTLKIVFACLAAGIIAGLLSAAQCQPAEIGCQIAALQVLSDEPISWMLWLHWINWLPGIVFGLLFAVSALEPGEPDRLRRTAVFALGSGAAYLLAGLLFFLLLSPARGVEYGMIVWVWPAGIGAGLVGALALAMLCNLLVRAPGHAGTAFVRTWLPGVVGALAGVLFVWICIYGEQQIFIAWPIAFVVWQVAIGLTLRFALLRQPGLRPSAPQSPLISEVQ